MGSMVSPEFENTTFGVKISLFFARITLLCPYFSAFHFKVAYTSGPIIEKIMNRYPIFSVQIINYQIDQMHK